MVLGRFAAFVGRFAAIGLLDFWVWLSLLSCFGGFQPNIVEPTVGFGISRAYAPGPVLVPGRMPHYGWSRRQSILCRWGRADDPGGLGRGAGRHLLTSYNLLPTCQNTMPLNHANNVGKQRRADNVENQVEPPPQKASDNVY